jgi:exodeoxyribonuclease-3
MRILTWNVNGLRAAIRKGYESHIERLEPDACLLQEIRVLPEQLPAAWNPPEGWNVHWHPAQRKGYSGTATLARAPLKHLGTGINGADDPEGRVLVTRVGGVVLVNIYLPAGASSPEAQERKNRWIEQFKPWAATLRKRKTPVILAGDFNIARSERDIYHWKSNRKTSGFLPHERDWMNQLVDSGWSDVVREEAGDVDGPYTWWSNRGQARILDRGWRIDYVLLNASARKRLRSVHVDREAALEVSDHGPVLVELE